MKNKKGENLVLSNIVFIIVNVLFLLGMILFIARAGSGADFYEEVYSKKIALIIDQAKPGTNIELDISELVEQAEKNGYKGKIVELNQEKNLVVVKLEEGGKNSFNYFTDVAIEISEDKANRKLNLIFFEK